MLIAVIADALFLTVLFVESLATLSMLQAFTGLKLREEFTPIIQFYHAKTAPLASLGASLYGAKAQVWFADAILIAFVLFYSFFIAQARNAMAPYEGDAPATLVSGKPTPLEAAIDFLLPAGVCAAGAAVTAPALLPFLTLPIALWLLLKRLFGRPSWFEVSASYYVNAGVLAAIAAAVLMLAQ